MECGVETNGLREPGQRLLDLADRGEGIGHMQWIEGHERSQTRQQFGGDAGRRLMRQASVDQPVPDRIEAHAVLVHEAQQCRNRLCVSKGSMRFARMSTAFVADPQRSIGRAKRLNAAFQQPLLVRGSLFRIPQT
jgi:hypothetical protein